MHLVKFNPWKEISAMEENINRFFGDTQLHRRRAHGTTAAREWKPVVDIYEDEDKFVITADLPGVKREEIDIDYKERILTLSGERKIDDDVSGEGCNHRERLSGKFIRRFSLPEMVAADRIEAKFKDGVLTIEVPKPEEQKTRKVAIN
jgi:HSP20 family protein